MQQRLVRRSALREGGSYTGQFLKPVLGRRENKRKKSVQAAERAGAMTKPPIDEDETPLGAHRREISPHLTKAIGEELVKYQLLARGWEVFNLNTISHNHPNADLLAVKGKTVIRIQVKTSKYRDWVQLGWLEAGKSNVNNKSGDYANYFAMVGHAGPDDYSIHIIPASYLKDWEIRNLAAHASHGRSKNAGYIYFGTKRRKTKFQINESGDEFEQFRGAWHLLETQED